MSVLDDARPGPRLYDVTVPLRPGMPTWDGEPGPTLKPLKQIGLDGEPAQVSLLTLGTHCGTHVDAPAHFIPGGAGVDALPLDALVGPCRVIEVDPAAEGRAVIEPADLAPAAGGVQRLLLKTPSGQFWADPPFRRDFVGLSGAAASWLVGQGVRLVGIDELSVDPYDADPYVAHLTLLGAGIVILEGLDLRAVPPGEYDLLALPLRLDGADGSPARVVLRSL
ncbi:MAG: cyclase family protein [Chloroflexi bacterium]|nr:cyclase family protein [Chloroflexota bacterium]